MISCTYGNCIKKDKSTVSKWLAILSITKANMSKANNKDTKMMSLTSLWCLHHQLWPCPTPHSNALISDPKKTTVYWTMIISRENTLRVKPAEPNKHSYMYHKRNIVGNQRFQIIISIIKNHYFICRSIPSKQQDSESTSVLLEYLKTYFHKVEFSILLENRKCTKNTTNISN